MPPLIFCFCWVHTISVLYRAYLCMKCSFGISNFLEEISLVFPFLLFSSISLHWSLWKAFLSLAILWNSAFRCLVKSLSCVRLFVTPLTVAYEASPSMGFSRQEYWSGLPFPSPGDLPDPGIETRSPTLQADTLSSEPPGKPSDAYIFPFLLWFSLLFFSQLFVKTAILLFCISFPWGWSWSLSPVQCYELPSIVHQALYLSDLIT